MKSNLKATRGVLVGLLSASLAFASAAGLAAQAGSSAKLYEFSGLNIAPGADSSALNFAWFSPSASQKAIVQVAKKADQKGDAFPEAKAKSYAGTLAKVVATQFNADDKTAALSAYAGKVAVTGLAEATDYVYRVGDGKLWSGSYALSTSDPKSFGFFVVGDPQLGAKSTGPKTLASDTAGWQDTIAKATTAYPKASFLVSLGDEVNDYNAIATQDAEYAAYFSPASSRACRWPPSTATTTSRWANTTATTITSRTSPRSTGPPTATTATIGSSTATPSSSC